MIYRARMFFAVAASAVLLQALLQASQPNIVLIVSDDQGWNDVSYHGGAIPTPNIDRIAQEGVQLERYYACPVCTPTRAGLMTGRYPIRFGMQRAVCRPFLKVGVPPAEETLPEMLGRAGYRYRGAAGKWHIGHAFRKYHPLNQGFNFYIGHYNGNIDYFTHFREGELDWHRGFEANFDEGYSTDLIADAAVDYIDRRAGDGPFFLYVPFNAPHTPFQVPDKWLPPFAQVENEKRRIYMAMVAALDAAVGRILEAIDRNGPDRRHAGVVRLGQRRFFRFRQLAAASRERNRVRGRHSGRVRVAVAQWNSRRRPQGIRRDELSGCLADAAPRRGPRRGRRSGRAVGRRGHVRRDRRPPRPGAARVLLLLRKVRRRATGADRRRLEDRAQGGRRSWVRTPPTRLLRATAATRRRPKSRPSSSSTSATTRTKNAIWRGGRSPESAA